MNWIALFFAIELGFAPFYNSLNVFPESINRDVTDNIYYVLLETEVTIGNRLFIGGIVKTYIQSTIKWYDYYPFESDYLFKAGLRFENLEVGLRYLCLHPVRPYEIYYQPQGSTDANYKEFYIRIEKRT